VNTTDYRFNASKYSIDDQLHVSAIWFPYSVALLANSTDYDVFFSPPAFCFLTSERPSESPARKLCSLKLHFQTFYRLPSNLPRVCDWSMQTASLRNNRRSERSGTADYPILPNYLNSIHSPKGHQKGKTANRYRLDGPGIESRWRRDFPHRS
jgi:hypothetical protein